MPPTSIDLSSLSLNDSYTFVTPDGQRYRFERITNRDEPGQANPLLVQGGKDREGTDSANVNHHTPRDTPSIVENSLPNHSQLPSHDPYGQTSSLQCSESSLPWSDAETSRSRRGSPQMMYHRGSVSQMYDNRGENPVLPYSDRHYIRSTQQLAPLENAIRNPMIPVSPSYTRFPPVEDGLIPVVASSSRSNSVTSKPERLTSGDRLVFERYLITCSHGRLSNSSHFNTLTGRWNTAGTTLYLRPRV